jgi:hypothetical protein
MTLRHAAVLALVDWYLMVPPVELSRSGRKRLQFLRPAESIVPLGLLSDCARMLGYRSRSIREKRKYSSHCSDGRRSERILRGTEHRKRSAHELLKTEISQRRAPAPSSSREYFMPASKSFRERSS